MSTYVQDSFTAADGTALNARSPDIGGTWTRHPGAASSTPPEIQGGKLVATTNNTYQNWFVDNAPSTPDYWVEFDWIYNGATDIIVGPMARAHPALNTTYAMVYRKSVGGMQMRAPGGAIGTDVAFTPATGGSGYMLRTKCTGTSIQGFVKRYSDNQWLTSAGTWSATEQACITVTDTNITVARHGGIWLAETTGTRSTIDNFKVLDALTPPATGTTLSGPSSGVVGVASTNFTVGVSPGGGEITGTLTVTPNDGGAGGTFTPTTVALTTASPTATFTYTPSTTGAKTIGITDNGGLTDASSLTYTVNAAPATAVTMTGPTSGVVGTPSSNFTVACNGAITGTVVVTPSDGGAGGTFTPTSRSLSSGSPTGTFTYTAASAGAKTISATNNGGLTNPSNITFTASTAAATAITLTGPTAGTVGSASTPFSVGANGVITGTVVVTPSDSAAGGTFTPSSVSINSASPTATFTYTASSAGAKSISTSDNGGLTDPTPISYTASTAQPWVRTDFIEPASGQPSMVLVPTSYNSGTPTDLVIYCHGQNGPQHAPDSETDPRTITTVLANNGMLIAASAARSNSWGNPGSVDDNAQLERYMRANYNIRHVFLWGASMGGIVALNVLASNRFAVKGVILHAPVVSLQALHNNGSGAYAGIIDAAYGVTGTGQATYAIKTRGHDPALRPAAAYSRVPMVIYASPSDGTVAKATNADVLAALMAGWTREVTLVAATGGHIDSSHYQPSHTLAFIQRCQAAPVAQGRPATTRTVSVPLTTDGTTPASAATGLKWYWWDEASPKGPPVDQGVDGVIVSGGTFTRSVASNLPVGGVGYLEVNNLTGSLTQSGARAFTGPVQVS